MKKKIIIGVVIGFIAVAGIFAVVGSLNSNPSNEELANYIFDEYDVNNDGLLEYDELLNYTVVIGSDVSGFLDYWDLDGNKALDKDEIMNWIEKTE